MDELEPKGVHAAICLSGEPRDFDVSFEDLSSKLDFRGHDLFAHTWYKKESGVSELPLHRGRGGKTYQEMLSVASSSQFMDKIEFRSFIAEKYPSNKLNEIEIPYGVDPHIPRMLSMFYSISKSFESAQGKNYDLYIRARPDLFLSHHIDLLQLKNACNNVSKYVIIPDLYINVGGYEGSWSPEGDYCPDFFWIMDASAYEEMSTIFSDIIEYCDWHRDVNQTELGNWPMHPEHYLMRWFKKKSIKVFKINIRMMLYRHVLQIQQTGAVRM